MQIFHNSLLRNPHYIHELEVVRISDLLKVTELVRGGGQIQVRAISSNPYSFHLTMLLWGSTFCCVYFAEHKYVQVNYRANWMVLFPQCDAFRLNPLVVFMKSHEDFSLPMDPISQSPQHTVFMDTYLG